jgi:hypothetical protein
MFGKTCADTGVECGIPRQSWSVRFFVATVVGVLARIFGEIVAAVVGGSSDGSGRDGERGGRSRREEVGGR